MNWSELSIEKVAKELNTNLLLGLEQSVASNRLKKYGQNILPKSSKASWLNILLKQFSNFMAQFLIFTVLITILLQRWLDAIPIAIIIVINALIGFIQEYKAELTLDFLKELITPYCKVIRNGELKKIIVSDLVPGDLLVIKSGDKIPADGRIIESNGLTIEESSLTGEASSVHKTADSLNLKEAAIGDRLNMVFMGTIAVEGDGKIIVTETGINTELGKVASILEKTEVKKTPLEQQVAKAINLLIVIFFIIITIVLISDFLTGKDLLSIFFIGISLAVAAIPEGLPTIITIALAIGTRKMANKKAVIRHLNAIEKLGAVATICTDKTGTLTQSKMAAKNIWTLKNNINIENYENFILPNNPELTTLLTISALCNKAELIHKDGKTVCIGDPTDCAILQLAEKGNIDKSEIEKEYKLIKNFPFDSVKKIMSSLREAPSRKKVLYIKGASDIILNLSKFILNEKNEAQPLTDEIKKEIETQQNIFSKNSLRVLGFAYKEIDNIENILEQDLTFVGLVGLINPLRTEAHKSIEICQNAGIKVVMITGDYKETALSIAKEINILNPNSKLMTGVELDQISDKELEKEIKSIAVFARVSPYHKLRIINAWKKTGNITAMTGDGINDAPALKSADVGIAMGITGTDIAKEASDMVILDDNFYSIVNAIKEGRSILENISKSILYLFSSNIAELFVIFIITLSGGFIPFVPIQILWLNLITDGFPAIALALDSADRDIMNKNPEYYKKPLLNKKFITEILHISFFLSLGAIVSFYYGLKENIKVAQTMALTTLVILSFLRIQIIRTRYGKNKKTNFWLLISLTVSLLLHLLILYIPFLQKIFQTNALTIDQWIFIFIIAVILLIIDFLIKNFPPFKLNSNHD